MQKKLSLTAAIYYYYYLLHHILLQLYYKFPLKSNHILKLFTAKLEKGSRQKVHIPAWAWTFLQFIFAQTQHLTLLFLKDGRAEPWPWMYFGTPERCLEWWKLRQSFAFWCARLKSREMRSEIVLPYVWIAKHPLISAEPEFHSSWRDG